VWREQLLVPIGASPEKAAEAKAEAAAAADRGAARWELVADLRDARGAVSHVEFAPPEHGLRLVTGGHDGVIRFYAPRNALSVLGWELVNDYEALVPGAEITALAWRRPTAADDVRGEVSGEDVFFSAPPPAIAVGFAWYGYATDTDTARGGFANAVKCTTTCDARVLTYDEGSMRWRVGSNLFQSGEGTPAASVIAWAPNADASGAGSVETLAAAIGSEVAVFRVEGLSGPARGTDAENVSSPGARDEDQNALVCGAESGEARSRRAATLSHPGPVLDLDWNMVGTTLATSASDGVVRVWAANMQTGVWEARAQLVGE